MRRELQAMVLLILAAGVATGASAQPVQRQLPHKIECRACRLELTPLLSFGGADLPVDLDPAGTLGRDSRGRYYAIANNRSQIAVFDSSGSFLSTIGRQGSGPGEFASGAGAGIRQLWISAQDTLFVWHGNGNFSVFSPTNAFVRQFKHPAGLSSGTLMPNGVFFIRAIIRSADRIGYPFHLMDRDGNITKSFGTDEAQGVSSNDPALQPYVGHYVHGSAVWVNRGANLEQWSFDGRLLKSYSFTNVPWLPKPIYGPLPQSAGGVTSGGRGGTPIVGPRNLGSAQLAGIDSAGRVWLRVRIPEGTPANPGATAKTVLEIFDPRSESWIASVDSEAHLVFIRADNVVWSSVTDNDGVISQRIFRVRLRQ